MEDARCVDFYGYFPAHGWPPSCLQQPGWKLTPTEPSRSSSASRPSKSRQRSTRCGNPSCADRKSVVWGKSVDLGGRRIIKKKKERKNGGTARTYNNTQDTCSTISYTSHSSSVLR